MADESLKLKVFISYAREDGAKDAEQLSEALQAAQIEAILDHR